MWMYIAVPLKQNPLAWGVRQTMKNRLIETVTIGLVFSDKYVKCVLASTQTVGAYFCVCR